MQVLLFHLTHVCICSVLLPYNSPGYLLSHGQNTVKVYNEATGEVMNSTLNATSTEMFSMTAPVTFVYSTPHKGVIQNCEQLVFSVSAASSVGLSSPAVVTGGFPIGNLHTHCLYCRCLLFVFF